jgi:hypothetical protein
MRILIGYFKQYTVRKNLQEMQVRFYTKNKRQESAYMNQYEKYIA